MEDSQQEIVQKSLTWLKDRVFPLWSTEGFDYKENIFVENLSFESKAQNSPARALVQARQIYSFAEGARLQVLSKNLAKNLIWMSAHSLIEKYSLPNGAIVNSIDKTGHLNSDLDLYSQAFALFGLAQAFEMCGDAEFRNAALKIVSYLNSERRNLAGGFTEIKAGKLLFQSNPHMHLFESVIAWMNVDQNPMWTELAAELSELSILKFIDPSTGFLAEHFDENWKPFRENGNFICEPGHHFEWSWLFIQYQKLNKNFKNNVSQNLFDIAEKFGVSEKTQLAYDEIWSDGDFKKVSSRFWPQCERVKAAVVLGDFFSADQAMKSLMTHFLILEKGLWKDTRLEDGTFKEQIVKASSLYHIINAISEYAQLRPNLNDVLDR